MSTLILLMLILLGVIETQAVEWLPNIIQPFNLGWLGGHCMPAVGSQKIISHQPYYGEFSYLSFNILARCLFFPFFFH